VLDAEAASLEAPKAQRIQNGGLAHVSVFSLFGDHQVLLIA
jgi:hypothetical protein